METRRDKNKFILEILDYVVNRKVDPLVSDKLLKLVGNEIGKDDELNKEILERLGKVEKLLNDRKVEIPEKIQLVKDGKGEDKEEKNIIRKKKFSSLHNPIQTTEILKRFKYNNDSGFKELVHSPTDIESFTIVNYEEILNKTEQSFKTLLNVPYLIYMNIKELNKLMHIEGKQVVESTNKHPYLNDFSPEIKLDNYENLSKTFPNKTITNLIQGFKKNYRFGFEETESSILKDLISHVFNKVSDKFNNARGNNENHKEFSFAKDPSSSGIIIDIHFSDLFDDFSVFFTWVPNVKNILYTVAEDILKHGNLTGSSEYKSHSKTIEFSIEKKYDATLNCTKILFSILDEKSICKKSPALLFEQMKDKMDYLTRGICDWSIESDFNKGSYFLQFLSETTTELSIVRLDKPIRGFKHTFTFYD